MREVSKRIGELPECVRTMYHLHARGVCRIQRSVTRGGVAGGAPVRPAWIQCARKSTIRQAGAEFPVSRQTGKRRPQAPFPPQQVPGDQRPSSNTTSRLTDSVVSPGATAVSISALPARAIAIIGIGGRKPPLLPSEMLTMRRTRRPSDLA